MIQNIHCKKTIFKMYMRNYLFAFLALYTSLQIHIVSTADLVYAQDQLRGFELYQEMSTLVSCSMKGAQIFSGCLVI